LLLLPNTPFSSDTRHTHAYPGTAPSTMTAHRIHGMNEEEDHQRPTTWLLHHLQPAAPVEYRWQKEKEEEAQHKEERSRVLLNAPHHQAQAEPMERRSSEDKFAVQCLLLLRTTNHNRNGHLDDHHHQQQQLLGAVQYVEENRVRASRFNESKEEEEEALYNDDDDERTAYYGSDLPKDENNLGLTRSERQSRPRQVPEDLVNEDDELRPRRGCSLKGDGESFDEDKMTKDEEDVHHPPQLAQEASEPGEAPQEDFSEGDDNDGPPNPPPPPAPSHVPRWSPAQAARAVDHSCLRSELLMNSVTAPHFEMSSSPQHPATAPASPVSRSPLASGSAPTLGRLIPVSGSLSPTPMVKKTRKPKYSAALEARWEEKFEWLLSYKRVKGNCRVAEGNKEYPGLGKWLSNQKTLSKNGKLKPDRVQRLIEIGAIRDPSVPAQPRGSGRTNNTSSSSVSHLPSSSATASYATISLPPLQEQDDGPLSKRRRTLQIALNLPSIAPRSINGSSLDATPLPFCTLQGKPILPSLTFPSHGTAPSFLSFTLGSVPQAIFAPYQAQPFASAAPSVHAPPSV